MNAVIAGDLELLMKVMNTVKSSVTLEERLGKGGELLIRFRCSSSFAGCTLEAIKGRTKESRSVYVFFDENIRCTSAFFNRLDAVAWRGKSLTIKIIMPDNSIRSITWQRGS